MATPQELRDALYGKVRGHPVGIKLFCDGVPESFTAVKVDPRRIVLEEQMASIGMDLSGFGG